MFAVAASAQTKVLNVRNHYAASPHHCQQSLCDLSKQVVAKEKGEHQQQWPANGPEQNAVASMASTTQSYPYNRCRQHQVQEHQVQVFSSEPIRREGRHHGDDKGHGEAVSDTEH